MSSLVPVDTDQTEGGAVKNAAKPDGTRRVLMPLLVMLLGLAVLLYPVVSTQWNNWLQQRSVNEYNSELLYSEQTDPEAMERAMESARLYNEEHTDGPVLDPWLARISQDNAEYQDYLKELSDYPAMSQVAIPSIKSNMPVYHGTDEEVLQKGIGHLFGSALPTGGEGNHTVLTGHTGLTNATLWDNLIDVKEGDAVYLNTYGHKMKYEVHNIEVVLPGETDSLKAQADEDLLTLITCTPYGINTHRLLVHAHRVPMDPSEADVFEETNKLMQWWMWLVLAIAVAAIIGIIWWLRKQRRSARGESLAAADGSAEEQVDEVTAPIDAEGEDENEN